MNIQVRVSTRAASDADIIFSWIAERSWDGALRWHQKYMETLRLLPSLGVNSALALEASDLKLELREIRFGTRKGNRYRVLFLVRDDVIFVVGVRGPGQSEVTQADLDLPN